MPLNTNKAVHVLYSSVHACVTGQAIPTDKKNFLSTHDATCPETKFTMCTLESTGANEASAQQGYKMQNRTSAYRHAYRSPNTKFLIKLWTFENRQFCMRTVWRQVVQENPMQIVYRHLPRLPI